MDVARLRMTDEELREYGEQRHDRLGMYCPTAWQSPLWRYVDLARFLSMLEEQSLFFARADTIGDSFEGSFGRGNTQLPDELKPQAERYAIAVRQHFYVNCWHLNEFESAAMWKLYAFHEGSIAVRSSCSRLDGVLPRCVDQYGLPTKGHIDYGQVWYLDYDHDRVFEGFTFDAFLRKRKSFAHEQEVRAFFLDPEFPDIPRWLWIDRDASGKPCLCPELATSKIDYSPGPKGIHVQVDLNALIEAVYISPTAPEWTLRLVQSVCKRYGLNVPVRRSKLEEARML